MTRLHDSQKETKDSAGTRVVNRAQLISRTRSGESVQVNGTGGNVAIARAGVDSYTVDGKGSYSLQHLLIVHGAYHAEFGEAVFFAA